jgi:hypothetical protein
MSEAEIAGVGQTAGKAASEPFSAGWRGMWQRQRQPPHLLVVSCGACALVAPLRAPALSAHIFLVCNAQAWAQRHNPSPPLASCLRAVPWHVIATTAPLPPTAGVRQEQRAPCHKTAWQAGRARQPCTWAFGALGNADKVVWYDLMACWCMSFSAFCTHARRTRQTDRQKDTTPAR